MSTFSGLIVGVVTAAAVTVFYGDQINSWLRNVVAEQLPVMNVDSRGPVASLGEIAFEQVLPATVEPDPEAIPEAVRVLPVVNDSVASAVPSPAPLPAAKPAPAPAVQQVSAADLLQQRWADYSANALGMRADGDFPYRECFTRAAATHGLPETLLLAVARGESNFNPAARSNKNAVGLMQIQWPGTSKHLGVQREADLYDPCTNVSAGAKYLVELSERYGGDLHRVLGAYNYGPSRITSGPMPEGARWYSQYIYQHLQGILGEPHVASSELLASRPGSQSGYQVLMTFNAAYRAREFMQFLNAQVPGIELAQRSESLGLHEVVLLYKNSEERKMALQMLQSSGLLALTIGQTSVSSL